MGRTFIVLLFFGMVLARLAAADVAPQASTSSKGRPKPKPGVAFQCQRLPILSGNGSQVYRLECFTGDVRVGAAAEGLFNWTSGMTENTTIRSVELQLVGHPVDSAEGVDYMSLSASFVSGRYILPTCASQTRFALRFNQPNTVSLSYPKTWARNSARHGRPKPPSCSGKLRALSPATGNSDSGDSVESATFKGWYPKPRMPVPDGLRVQLNCQKGSAGGVCAAMVRLLVQFEGNDLHEDINAFEKLSREMEDKLNFNCEDRSWLDTDGLLGVKNKTVGTEVCYPPKGTTSSGGRRLLQGTPVAQTVNMAPVYAYDNTIITKATRFARYASAIHGCLPSTSTSNQTYTAPDGSTQLREWTGPTGMSNWGGPGSNGQPGPSCQSCFKDGIDWTDPPKGFQTPEHSDANPNSFLDAVIVFTDTVISGVTGQKAVVVLFRATATAIQPSQWISNLGYCVADSGSMARPTTDPASGSVCDGWNTPVNDLIALGLQAEVLRRLNAFKSPADRTVYVAGHSRGGSLASVFAAKLITLQANGGLPSSGGAKTDQIKLYTFGSPRTGDTYFAAYLENNMMERYRIITRYDAVPTEPSSSSGYDHYRPSIWYRDSTDNFLPSPRLGCLLYNENQLTTAQQACFISCNSVLTCSYGAGVVINSADTAAFTSVPQCTDLSDSEIQALSGLTLTGSTTLIDHMSYLGIDMANTGCRADVSFLASISITPGNFFGYTCTSLD